MATIDKEYLEKQFTDFAARISEVFAKIVEAGCELSLDMDTTNYLMTIGLKNAKGEVLSSKSIDFPLESVVVDGDLDEETGEFTLTLQNGNTIGPYNMSAIVSGLVKDTLTVAGIPLKGDITAQQLIDALGLNDKYLSLKGGTIGDPDDFSIEIDGQSITGDTNSILEDFETVEASNIYGDTVYYGNQDTDDRYVKTEDLNGDVDNIAFKKDIPYYNAFNRNNNGLVPHPTTTTSTRFLREDGTWQIPTDSNTDTKVTQTNTTTSANYRVLLSENANDSTETVGARKSSKFYANPSTGVFSAYQFEEDSVKLEDKYAKRHMQYIYKLYEDSYEDRFEIINGPFSNDQSYIISPIIYEYQDDPNNFIRTFNKYGHMCIDNADGKNNKYNFKSFVNRIDYGSSNIIYSNYSASSAESGISFYTINNKKNMHPISDKIINLGLPSYLWNDIYAVNGTIQTSDRNEKNSFEEITPKMAKALILGLKPTKYKMNSSTSKRYHWGLIAQDIEDQLEKLNWDSKDFAGFIKSPHYETEEVDEEYIVVLDDGKTETRTRKKTIENLVPDKFDYSLRYNEFISPMICVIQDHEVRLVKVEETVQKHEKEINTLNRTVQEQSKQIAKLQAANAEFESKISNLEQMVQQLLGV